MFFAAVGQGALLPVAWKKQFGDWPLIIAILVPAFLLTVPRGLFPERPTSVWKTIAAAWHLLMAVLVIYGVTQTPWDPLMTFFLLAMAPGAVIAVITLCRFSESRSSANSMEPSPVGLKEPSNEPIE